jgi:cytochrome c oxidase cbb3-type subunit 3
MLRSWVVDLLADWHHLPMLSIPKSLCMLLLGLLALCAVGSVATSQMAQPRARQKDSEAASTLGKKTFASTCASCHGLDGRGGERAPNIAERPSVQQLSDAQLFHIIENGIPGTGMPAFHALESPDIKAVVIYLRSLQGAKKPLNKLPGDPEHGEAIFFGKAGCSTCHMVTGKGGFIASDLSKYAGSHALDQIRNAITNPLSNDNSGRVVMATVRGGEKYSGRVRNEDNFSVQLQALDGIFHFFEKSDLEGLEYSPQSLMPSDYGSTLSLSELSDVVSYLMRVANTSATREKPEKEFEEE